jgi:pimeloyl-ACP methyl ester carboxylesterase
LQADAIGFLPVAFARRIPDARLHVVDGGGHLFLLERPAEMAALVTGFLAERR